MVAARIKSSKKEENGCMEKKFEAELIINPEKKEQDNQSKNNIWGLLKKLFRRYFPCLLISEEDKPIEAV